MAASPQVSLALDLIIIVLLVVLAVLVYRKLLAPPLYGSYQRPRREEPLTPPPEIDESKAYDIPPAELQYDHLTYEPYPAEEPKLHYEGETVTRQFEEQTTTEEKTTKHGKRTLKLKPPDLGQSKHSTRTTTTHVHQTTRLAAPPALDYDEVADLLEQRVHVQAIQSDAKRRYLQGYIDAATLKEVSRTNADKLKKTEARLKELGVL